MRSDRGQAVVGTTTLFGTEAVTVEVQVDVTNGLPAFMIVGLGDAAVLEARERVRAAVRASGFAFPNARIVVNLAPGPLRKHGTGFDLPIALAILQATGQLNGSVRASDRAVGELALDGSVRAVPGMLAHGLAARAADRALIGPTACQHVVGMVPGLRYRPVSSLASILGPPSTAIVAGPGPDPHGPEPDLADVCGQQSAKRALEIAAAGGHSILFTGPPGAGKTMLARRLAPIMPPLGVDERLESAVVHSIAGLDERAILAGVRPFRAPHHSASIAGLVGGGTPLRPGEISLAHRGVLFLDELPEFGPAALQALRQPMEAGTITLVRSERRVSLPARFTLVAAANPCPCGHMGDPAKGCRCTEAAVSRYQGRIGGPLIDRIDLVLFVERVDPGQLVRMSPGEPSHRVRERVCEALERSIADVGAPTSSLAGTQLLDACRLTPRAREELSRMGRHHNLSGRGVSRLLRVARTIAYLERRDRVTEDHLFESLVFRGEGMR